MVLVLHQYFKHVDTCRLLCSMPKHFTCQHLGFSVTYIHCVSIGVPMLLWVAMSGRCSICIV